MVDAQVNMWLSQPSRWNIPWRQCDQPWEYARDHLAQTEVNRKPCKANGNMMKICPGSTAHSTLALFQLPSCISMSEPWLAWLVVPPCKHWLKWQSLYYIKRPKKMPWSRLLTFQYQLETRYSPSRISHSEITCLLQGRLQNTALNMLFWFRDVFESLWSLFNTNLVQP